MKLVELKCKNCGSVLEQNETDTDMTCPYCHTKFKLDDEVWHVQYDNMERAGYEFEKGKIRARQEALQSQYRPMGADSSGKKTNTWLWILGWIVCFPIPLTLLIWRSNWEKRTKIAVIVMMWALLLFIGATSDKG